jgi:tetratricopeptide (TPR) repeat protein
MTLFAYRGELGLERDRAYVERALGGRMETAHFEIYFDAGAFDERARKLLASDHEARFEEVGRMLGVAAPAKKLRSFVYGNREQKGALMGARNTLFAKVWLGEMQILWSGLGDSMLAHELTHLMLAESAGNWTGLPTRFGLPLNGVLEGVANAVEWSAEERDDHAWSAAIERLGKGVPVAELMTPTGFWSRSGDTVYTLSGSFIRWLIETRGAASFLAVYRSGDPVAAYGADWAALERDWRAFLASYPLTAEELDAASFRFDRPSVFEKRCARTIASRFEEASSKLSQGADAEAARCLEQILADDPSNLLYKMRVAGLLRRAGSVQRAEALTLEVAGDERATRAQRGDAKRSAGDLAWARGETAKAQRLFEEALSLTPGSGGRRALGVRLQALAEAAERPMAAEAIRRYLGAEGPALAISALELGEAVATEQSQVARYLLAVRLLQLDASAATERLAAEALAAEGDPARAAFLLRVQGRYLARTGAAQQACEVWKKVASAAPKGSEGAVEAAMWLGRCEAGSLPNLDAPPSEWE